MKKIGVGFLCLYLLLTTVAFAELYKYTDDKGGIHFTDNPMNLPQEQRNNITATKTTNVESIVYNDAPQKQLNVYNKRETELPQIMCIDDGNNPSIYEKCYVKLCTTLISDNDFIENDLKTSSDEYKKWKNAIQVAYGVSDENICSLVNQESRFATPEATWTLFKESLLQGKTDDALACFSFGSLKKYRDMFNYLGREELKQMATEMLSIQRITSSEESAKYRIRRKENGQEITYYIYFDNFAGNWKIRQF